MTKIRAMQADSFIMPNSTIMEDNTVSWDAKGVFMYLWSCPEDHEFIESEIAGYSSDDLETLKNALNELEQKGYLKRSMDNAGNEFIRLFDKPTSKGGN